VGKICISDIETGGFIIKFQPISLQDKPLFDLYFRKRRYDNSDCTFTNLYMWRKAYRIAWTVENGFLYLKGSWDGTVFAFAPFGRTEAGFEDAVLKLIEYFHEHNLPFIMKGVTADILGALQVHKSGRFANREDRDSYDYVYYARALVESKGRAYNSKKNHINFFERNYPNYEYRPITDDVLPSCIDMALQWHDANKCQDIMLEFEKDAIAEALNNFDYLSLQGGVILLDGKVEAFAFGEYLNEDTAVIHIEKGNPAIRGIYQIINREFCRNAWMTCTYINREEDMGIPGLREAKQSYRPIKMVEKYDIILTNTR
jgi:uncharacterized protein